MILGSSFGQVMGLLLPTFWSFAAGLEPEAVIAGFQDMAVVGKSIEQEILVTSTAAPMGRQGSEQPSSVGAVLGGPDWISARALALLAHTRAMKDLADDMTHAALTPLLGRKLFAPLGDDQNGAPLSAVSAFVAARCRPLERSSQSGAHAHMR